MKIKKIDALNFLLILGVTPISIFTIFLSILKNSRFSVFLYALLISLISYSYKPFFGYDKTRHFMLYEYVKTLDFSSFTAYIFSFSPDFLFYSLLYFGGKVGLSFHHIVATCTFITIYLMMNILQNNIKNYLDVKTSTFSMFIVSLLCVCSIYYLDVLSGIRFYLAASFFLFALHINNKYKLFSLIFLFLSIATHYSLLLVLPLYFFVNYLQKINIFFLKMSMLLTLILSQFSSQYLDLAEKLGLTGALANKAQSYLSEGELNETSSMRVLFDIANIAWFYLLELYLIFTKHIKYSNYFFIIMVLLVVNNLFILIPEIYTRYALLIRFLLVIFLIQNLKIIDFRIILIFCLLLILSMLVQILVIYPSLLETLYPKPENITLFIRLIISPYQLTDLRE